MDDDLGRGEKVFLSVCIVVGAVLGLVVFAIFSGGSMWGYIFAPIGGMAVGLIAAVLILRGEWLDFLL